jgi:tetratricopeptide (TPR) repeat protein
MKAGIMIKSATFGLLVLFLTGCFCTVTGNEQAGPPATVSQNNFQHRLRTDDRRARGFAAYLKGRYAEKTGDLESAAVFLDKAADLDTEHSEVLVDLAHLHLRRGEIEKAVRAAEDALVRDPDNVLAHMLLGDIQMRRGRLSEAAIHMEKVLELQPDNEEVAVNLAVIYVQTGQSEKATDLLKRILARDPDAVNARLALARIYREIGLVSSASLVYQDLLKRHPDLIQAYGEWAEMLMESGRSDEAEKVLRQGLKDESGQFEVRHQLVEILLRQGRLNDARQELEWMLAQSPDHLESMRKLGLIEMEQGNWEAAESTFREILRHKPDHSQSLYHLGSALEEQQRWEDAIDAFSRVSSESVLYPDALVHLSYLYQRLGEDDLALRRLEEAVEMAPDRHQYYMYLASLLDEQGRYKEAIKRLQQGRRTTSSAQAEFSYRIGILYGKLDQWEQAVAEMRQALRYQPEHADALNFLAYHFAETDQNLEEALELGLKALSLKNLGYIHDTVGWIYFRLDRPREALRHLERAASELPGDPVVWEHLGEVWENLGELEKAKEAYRRALDIDPDAEQVREKLNRLAPEGL